MGGGAWPFLVGGVICLVNSDNERDPVLLVRRSGRLPLWGGGPLAGRRSRTGGSKPGTRYRDPHPVRPVSGRDPDGAAAGAVRAVVGGRLPAGAVGRRARSFRGPDTLATGGILLSFLEGQTAQSAVRYGAITGL